jgi:hypothetical protein
MLFIRDREEEMCQKIDIHDPVAAGKDLDKYSLEEYARIQGGGEAAVETVKIWTRVMLGNSISVDILKTFSKLEEEFTSQQNEEITNVNE